MGCPAVRERRAAFRWRYRPPDPETWRLSFDPGRLPPPGGMDRAGSKERLAGGAVRRNRIRSRMSGEAAPPPPMGRVYFFLILTTFFWGGSFLFTKIGVSTIPPQLFVLAGFCLATLIMLIAFAPRLKKLDRSIIRRGMIVGTALGLTNLSFVFGIQGTSISRAGVLNNLFVLFIPVITKIIWRDRIGRI